MSVGALLADYAVQVSAGVTATSAVGVLYEAHRIRSAVEDNTQRSATNRARSIGNRRWLRSFGARFLPSDEYRPPHQFDPEEHRTDGGETDG
ncbi:hypothetical protein [Halobaculum lipolyticum]|uniref:Uncharacterized protein n=1 Tax=Halobaculum lipolyticum TaxID=3032001 RepID=A0ABD5WG65_9EURY|nr:hypothetical protein [Halobaculum sp. DT31]